MIKGKILYETKGAAKEYGRIGCNFYTGCPHECTYCYLKRGAPSKQLGGNEVQLKKCLKDEETAYQILVKELTKWQAECQEHGIFLSFTTDPLIYDTSTLTLCAVINATQMGIPVWLLTKSASFIEIMDYLENMKSEYRAMTHFGFTLTGHDEMEPYANSNKARIHAMKKMKELGYPTWASIEPVIDWSSSIEMIQKSLDYCEHYKIGLRSGVKKDYYNAVETYKSVVTAKQMILNAGRTVYFKESVRNWMMKNVGEEPLRLLLRGTLDMDRNVIQ